MKVKAPFRVVETFKGHLELFAYRQMQTWFGEIEWGYWFANSVGWRKLPTRKSKRAVAEG